MGHITLGEGLMHAPDPHRSSHRLSRAAAVALAVVLPGSFLALTQSPASAAPLPAAYSADAHGDIIELDAQLLGQGSLADAAVGHSSSSVASTSGGGTTTATSANLDGSLVFGGLPIPVDT
jgi:hypothetical protein